MNTPVSLAARKQQESLCNTSDLLEWEYATRLSYDDHCACPMCNRDLSQDPLTPVEYVEIEREGIEKNYTVNYVRRHCGCGYVWTTETKAEAQARANGGTPRENWP